MDLRRRIPASLNLEIAAGGARKWLLAAMTAAAVTAIVRGDLKRSQRSREMEPMLMSETETELLPDDEYVVVHEWRAEQLRKLGLRGALADRFADRVDWRDVAALVARGCPAELAVEIVR